MIDEVPFSQRLYAQREQFEKEVQARNARYYDQQEEILYRNSLDRKAESEALIRQYRQKEKESRKTARLVNDPMDQLRHKKKRAAGLKRLRTKMTARAAIGSSCARKLTGTST